MNEDIKYTKSGVELESSSRNTGMIAEMLVAIDLARKGYEIFRPMSVYGSCDMLVMKDNQIIRIEVRTSHRNKCGSYTKPIRYTDKADIYAWVIHKENKIYYEPDISKFLG